MVFNKLKQNIFYNISLVPNIEYFSINRIDIMKRGMFIDHIDVHVLLETNDTTVPNQIRRKMIHVSYVEQVRIHPVMTIVPIEKRIGKFLIKP